MMYKNLLILFLVLIFINCNHKNIYINNTINGKTLNANTRLIELNNTLTEVLVKDQFSPPVASRIYAYCNLAYYTSLNNKDKSITKHIREFDIPRPELENIDEALVASVCFIKTAMELTYSAKEWRNELIRGFENSSDAEKIRISASCQDYVNQFMQWANKDNYGKRLAYERYSEDTAVEKYKLTPPTYKEPIEPHWGTIRPFFIHNINDFSCDYQEEFSAYFQSDFFKENKNLHTKSKELSDEEIEIALFWDCNPVQVDMIGHVMKYSFRMTPSSHWICILNQVAANQKIPHLELSKIYAILSMSMADAFIVCWNDKYKYNTIRPVTYIREYIDENWYPVIETPNFPEYPSGHSTVSNTAAFILTHFLGDNVQFVDASQKQFEVADRSFSSFKEAAQEAGMSRIYGGIHYEQAIFDGLEQGEKIAEYILEVI